MAAKINLLDWRAEQRLLRQNQFVAMVVAGFLLGAGGIVGANIIVTQKIEYQESRNAFLKGQIAEMDKKIKEIEELEKVRASLIGRMKVIEELQASRAAMVHFFDELVNTLPDGVYLKTLTQSGASVTVEGVAESNGRVSNYMKNIEASRWFADPKLVVIKTGEANKRRQAEFQLQFKNLTKGKPAVEGSQEVLE